MTGSARLELNSSNEIAKPPLSGYVGPLELANTTIHNASTKIVYYELGYINRGDVLGPSVLFFSTV